jgi:endonuclease YncB( thermonuclease family)
MRQIVRILLSVALTLFIQTGPVRADAVGKPTVVSGDVLEVAGQRVQLYGVDAPELDQICIADRRRFNCGHIAKTALMDLVAGAEVSCKIILDKKADLATAICTAGGFDIGSNMVHTGWALADRKLSEKYVTIEDKAREARRGLWRGQFIPPWKWRER